MKEKQKYFQTSVLPAYINKTMKLSLRIVNLSLPTLCHGYPGQNTPSPAPLSISTPDSLLKKHLGENQGSLQVRKNESLENVRCSFPLLHNRTGSSLTTKPAERVQGGGPRFRDGASG